MDASTNESKKVIHNLNVLRGQIDGVVRMIEEGRYCIDVSAQLNSMMGLLRKSNSILLRQHAHTCVSDAIKSNNGDKKIDELMSVIDKLIAP